MEFEGNWPKDVQQKFLQDMTVIENFISPSDEHELFSEIEPYLKRMRYERDHWDDAIQGFRETERKSWYPQNKEILNRVINRAFPNASQTLPHIHVLDLEATGENSIYFFELFPKFFFIQVSSSLTSIQFATAVQQFQEFHCYLIRL